MDVTILSRLMEHIPVGVITQEQGKIVYMNPAGKAILGVIRVHEVIGGINHLILYIRMIMCNLKETGKD